MLFWLLPLLVFLFSIIPVALHTAEPIKIVFQTDIDTATNKPKTAVLPVHIMNQFKNLSSLTVISSDGNNIPVTLIKKPTFDCLVDLITISQNEFMLLKPDIEKLSENLKEKLRTVYKDTSQRDLLLAAQFLGVNSFLKTAIASEYIEKFRNSQFPIVVDGKNIVIDNLTTDVEPIVAGCLLSNLLANHVWSFKHGERYSYKLKVGDGRKPSILSNNSADYGFGCIWWYQGTPGFLWNEKPHYRRIYFDFSKPMLNNTLYRYRKLQSQKIDLGLGHDDYSFLQCAVSSDGKYMLALADNQKANHIVVALYNNTNELENKNPLINAGPFANTTSHHCSFNTVTNHFNIVIAASEKDRTFLSFYDINPRTRVSQRIGYFEINDKRDPAYFAPEMGWRTVNGNLVGALQNQSQGLLCTMYMVGQNMLVPCTITPEKTFLYTTANGEEHEANFTIGIDKDSLTVFSTFLLNMEEIVTKLVTKAASAAAKYVGMPVFSNLTINFTRSTCLWGFNSSLLRYYFIDVPDKVGVYNIIPIELALALEYLTKKVITQNNVLIDAYFLYHYYSNPTTWRTICKDILEPMRLSAEIQKLYGLNKPVPTKQHTIMEYFWTTPQQRIRSMFSQYKNVLYGLGTIGGVGLAAYLLRTSVKNKSVSLPAPQ